MGTVSRQAVARCENTREARSLGEVFRGQSGEQIVFMCGPSTKGATEQVADDEALVDAAIAEFGLEPEVFQRLQEYGPIFSEKNAAVVNIIATRQRTGES